MCGSTNSFEILYRISTWIQPAGFLPALFSGYRDDDSSGDDWLCLSASRALRPDHRSDVSEHDSGRDAASVASVSKGDLAIIRTVDVGDALVFISKAFAKQ
jgi:hypothetical protein